MQPEQRITNAITWYRRNRYPVVRAIWQGLTIQGVTYGRKWPRALEGSIKRWEGDQKHGLAGCYIVRPLKRIKEVLEG